MPAGPRRQGGVIRNLTLEVAPTPALLTPPPHGVAYGDHYCVLITAGSLVVENCARALPFSGSNRGEEWSPKLIRAFSNRLVCVSTIPKLFEYFSDKIFNFA